MLEYNDKKININQFKGKLEHDKNKLDALIEN
jgi:hypothetical protein